MGLIGNVVLQLTGMLSTFCNLDWPTIPLFTIVPKNPLPALALSNYP